MIQDKQWWKSKTIWTSIVVCVACVAGEFGYVVPESVYGVLAALEAASVACRCTVGGAAAFCALPPSPYAS